MMEPSNVPRSSYPTGRPLLFTGMAVAVLGAIAYIIQLWLGHLTIPWYLPVSGSLGMALIFLSFRYQRNLWRVLAFLLFLLLTSGEWMFIFALRQPAYTGPVTVGQPFPAFSTLQADGATFTQHDLGGDHRDVLVFFRGRW